MSGPAPITAQVAAPPEQKRRSVSAGEFLRVRGEIPEGNPRMPVRIGNSHDAIGALYGDVAALVGEGEEPRIASNEVRAVFAVSGNLLASLGGIGRTEQNDEFVPSEARWVDLGARVAAEFDIGDAEPEVCHAGKLA